MADHAGGLVDYRQIRIFVQNIQGDFFGDQRLLDVIRRNSSRSAQEIQQAVLEEVQRFTGGAPKEDDIALVVLSRKS